MEEGGSGEGESRRVWDSGVQRTAKPAITERTEDTRVWSEKCKPLEED